MGGELCQLTLRFVYGDWEANYQLALVGTRGSLHSELPQSWCRSQLHSRPTVIARASTRGFQPLAALPAWRQHPLCYVLFLNVASSEHGLTQPAVDHIVDLCLLAQLAFCKHVMGRCCGTHPDNRAGSDVDPFNAQNLALKIPL